MGNVLNTLNLILFFICYAILILPVFIILIIADVIKKKRFIKMFDYNIMQNFEG
jgi:hypothetical protein